MRDMNGYRIYVDELTFEIVVNLGYNGPHLLACSFI